MARRGPDFGVVSRGPVTVDMKKVKERKDAVVRRSNEGVEGWLKNMTNCTVYEGHGRFEGPHMVRVGDQVLEADKIFVDVGARARVPPMPGLDTVDFLTNSRMLELEAMWIRSIDESKATGRVARVYETTRRSWGGVDNIIKAHSLNAAALEALMAFYRGVMHGDCELEMRQREMIAVTVSALNECHY